MNFPIDKYIRLSQAYIQLDERHRDLSQAHTDLKGKFLHLLSQFQQSQKALETLGAEHTALRSECEALNEFKRLFEPTNLQTLEEAIQAVEIFEARNTGSKDLDTVTADQVIAAYKAEEGGVDISTLTAQQKADRLVFEVQSEHAA
jgi:predicted nuclease with TOPRIM domain